MRVSTSTQGPRTIVQSTITNNNTIGPNTAATDLLRISGVDIQGGTGSRVRIHASGWVTLTGTTNTVRTVFFTLVHGAGNVLLTGGPVSLPNDLAATSLSVPFELDFILEDAPAAAADEFALRWSTGADATANVNGTVAGTGGAVLNVEELTGANSNVGPVADELILQCSMGTDPISLLTGMSNAFAAALVADINAQVVDIDISGGGAGNIYMAQFIFRLPQLVEDVAYPKLLDQIATMAWGQEKGGMHLSQLRWKTAFPAAELNFWANACSGDGAQFVEFFMFEPNDTPPDGPGLLAAESLVRAALPGRSVTMVSVRELVSKQLEGRGDTMRVAGVSPPPKRFAAHPARASGNTPPAERPPSGPKIERTRFSASPDKKGQ